MARRTVHIEGAREMRRAFKEMGPDATKALKDLQKRVADIVVQAALPKVPVGRTGKLKGSVRALGAQSSARAKAGTKRVNYAAVIHWGRSGVQGVPYLFDAAEAKRDEASKVFLEGIEEIVKEHGFNE